MSIAATTDLLRRTPGSPAVPAVAAHRGASGYRPEHTLAGYRLAIAQGADALELDLVSTADGVLVVRHDVELGRTTDVADHAGFRGRRTSRVVGGEGCTGWFVDDFTLAELRTLRARERFPRVRPTNTVYDGAEPVATFDDVLTLVARESERLDRRIGVLAELKVPSYFDARGLSLDGPLRSALQRHGADHPGSHVSVMGFEPTAMERLSGVVRAPIVQLLDRATVRPTDLEAAGDPRTYGDLVTHAGLAAIARYADAVGAHTDLVVPVDVHGGLGRPSTLVRDARREWLGVWTWTVRAENRFLPPCLRRGEDPAAYGDVRRWVRRLLAAGVDGIVTDHPDLVLAVRDAVPVGGGPRGPQV